MPKVIPSKVLSGTPTSPVITPFSYGSSNASSSERVPIFNSLVAAARSLSVAAGHGWPGDDDFIRKMPFQVFTHPTSYILLPTSYFVGSMPHQDDFGQTPPGYSLDHYTKQRAALQRAALQQAAVGISYEEFADGVARSDDVAEDMGGWRGAATDVLYRQELEATPRDRCDIEILDPVRATGLPSTCCKLTSYCLPIQFSTLVMTWQARDGALSAVHAFGFDITRTPVLFRAAALNESYRGRFRREAFLETYGHRPVDLATIPYAKQYSGHDSRNSTMREFVSAFERGETGGEAEGSAAPVYVFENYFVPTQGLKPWT